MKKQVLIGFLTAIFATLAGLFLYIELFSKFSWEETLKLITEGNLYGKVLSLAALANLFVFFVFIKKKQDAKAKGVLLATICLAILLMISKFF